MNAGAYAPFAATLSAVMVVSIAWSAWGTRQFIPFLSIPAADLRVTVGQAFWRTFADMAAALRQPDFRWLFIGVLLVYLMIGTNAALDIYMYTYFWEFSSSDIVLLTPTYAIGAVLGLLFAPAFQRRYGKRAGLLFGTVTWAGLQVLPILLRLAGLFPENDSAWLVPLLAVGKVLQGAGAVQANTAFGSAIADVADQNELQTGRRQEGVFFATSSFSGKFASGIGSLIAGVALDLIRWPRGANIRTAADVPPEQIVHLGIVYGPFVVGFSVVTYWCYSHYRLSREKHAEILAELARRREQAAAKARGTAVPGGMPP
jgi:Na+/melibiose symporter-like transporter